MIAMIPPTMPSTNKSPAGMTVIRRLSGIWTIGVVLFLYLPILLLVIYSFNKSELNIVWTGATMRWYRELWHNAPLMDALKKSLVLAGIVTVLSVPLGTIGAWLTHRYHFRTARAVLAVIYLPILMPDVIMGVSLLVLFSVLFRIVNPWWLAHGGTEPFSKGWVTLILAHTTFCFPFVMVGVQARLKGMDPSLEEAAMDLYANPARAFMPYLFPAIVSGALMAFTLSMDELIVTTFTNGPETKTLPVLIFGYAKLGFNPMLNAISAVFIVATGLVMGIAEWLRRPRVQNELSN